MSKVPDGLLYSREHEWVEAISETRVRVGISDFAQQQLGDLVFVELPAVGSQVKMDESLGTVESVKAVSDIFSPVSGTVAEINGNLENDPETINADPYGEGWLLVIELRNPAELSELLSAEQYTEFVSEE
ncbi:glycine cleavage system protein GcvH [Brevibacillus borstelensis]|jgi:glycine cleavage system H protein|uniref:glycine cleavage system protein GcvH n=1 Tax=Brevibacillus borstelensis TaxID=45462 RepID=UPI00046AB89B|nr:glycine cleavage system protein GcvH [Brevibacillus borstelensis]MCC0565681.1 glycine cleavage system protein GcvH [Brevibacillus borstelensis]MCM3471480.1 glycine cleavage system protein GcvH [Brevibacillus borstelensis]MCM3559570.1 glycine cleavage system protein GcvH [Brevibacillus borstelensis]MCM3592839.1 glycine cleavage system protein GcvH [Brevibacillus borstelensis]MED1851514.1 glycine cleavage system protein GcvH [Brevibacillus borstelensis]